MAESPHRTRNNQSTSSMLELWFLGHVLGGQFSSCFKIFGK